MKYLFPLLLITSLAGCAGTSQNSSSTEASSSSTPSALDLAVAHLPEDLSLCLAPAGAVITDIASVVEWVNAMPKPLTLACFIASLPRPITYNATVSTFSAQPSIGRHNPRIFIKEDKLWLSFVTQEGLALKEDSVTGIGSAIWDADNVQLLELGYEVESNRLLQQSIKGELAFPVLAELPENAPYAKVSMNGARTESVCGGCHGSETIIDVIDDIPVFRSTMLRNARTLEVSHGYLVNQYLSCDPTVNTGTTEENNEWYRCQMLEAFFGKGDMLWSSFPEEISTLL